MRAQLKIGIRRSWQYAACLALAALLLAGCSGVQDQMAQLEAQWGIRPVAIRLVGGEHFIDFRYRVTDPQKAATLLSRNNKAFLIDEQSGRVHNVPVTKLGPMRASAIEPHADKNYVVIFGNGEKILHKGSLVTVVIGDFRAEHLQVM